MNDGLYYSLNLALLQLLLLEEGHVASKQDAHRQAWERFYWALDDVLQEDSYLFEPGDNVNDGRHVLANEVKARMIELVAYVRLMYISRGWLKRRVDDARKRLLTVTSGRSLLQLQEKWEGGGRNRLLRQMREDYEGSNECEPTGDGELSVDQMEVCEAANWEAVEIILARINLDDMRVRITDGRLTCRRRARSRLARPRPEVFRTWVQYVLREGGNRHFTRVYYDFFPPGASPRDMSQAVNETNLEVYALLRELRPELPLIESGDEAGDALADFLRPAGTPRLEERRQITISSRRATGPRSVRTTRPIVKVHFSRLVAGDKNLRRLVCAYHRGLTATDISHKCYGQHLNQPKSLHPDHVSDLHELAKLFWASLERGHRYVIDEVDVARRLGRWAPAEYGR